MNLTVDALKAIYVALGGSASDVENVTLIPDMLEKIAVYAEVAATELPAVTAADNGNVLAVVNGKWNKAASSAGVKVTATISESSVTLETGYDFAKIKGLIDAGVEVKLIAGQAVYNLDKFGDESATFAHTAMFSSTKVDYSEIIVKASGSHEYQTVQLSSAS